jgi:hypothetical protein
VHHTALLFFVYFPSSFFRNCAACALTDTLDSEDGKVSKKEQSKNSFKQKVADETMVSDGGIQMRLF